MVRVIVLCLIGVAGGTPPAHANSACTDNNGVAPAAGSTLPVHPRIVHYTDFPRSRRSRTELTATINGKKVPLKVSILPDGGTTRVTMIEIDSNLTGRLKLFENKYVLATFTIKAKVKMPDKLPVALERFFRELRHSTVEEIFEGLALRLAKGTPAISAHVKLRRDSSVAWTELDLPISTDFDDPRPSIRIGRVGCSSNYSVPLLENGVDIEVTVTLADGTVLPVLGLASRVTLPPP